MSFIETVHDVKVTEKLVMIDAQLMRLNEQGMDASKLRSTLLEQSHVALEGAPSVVAICL